MQRGWVILAILMIIQLVQFSEPAAASGAHFKVDVGYGGYVAPGKWNPLRITVNQAIANGRVAIIRSGRGQAAERSVETFPLQGLQLELPVLADEDSGRIKIQILCGEQVLAEQTVDLFPKVFPGHLILAVEVPAAVQQNLAKVLLPGEPVRVAVVKTGDLGASFLHYDSVSALVMRDPGPVLAPLQVEAIYSWITSGGKLILGNARRGKRSLFGKFTRLKLPRDSSNGATVTIKAGRGEIQLWDEDFTVMNQRISSWQQVLQLKPYEQSLRLTASNCFPVLPPPPPRRKPQETSPRSAATYLGIYLFLGVWALLAAGVILTGQRRHHICSLVGFSLLAAIIAYPVGSLVCEQWQRGTKVNNRAVILPRSGGIIWASDIIMAGWEIYDNGARQSSPWGATVTLGRDDAGTVRSRNSLQTVWRHRIASPRALIREINPNALNLVGVLPPVQYLRPGDLASKTGQYRERNRNHQLSKEIACWEDQRWWQIQGQNRKPTPHSRIPNWLLEEREWVEKLIALFPAQSWVFRRGTLPELNLKIEGSPAANVLFVAPLGEE